MRNSLILIVLAVVFSGCATRKVCLRKFPPIESVIVKDSIIIRDSIVVKDTMIYVKLPADTVTVSVPVEIEVEVKPVVAETKYAKAEAWVADKKLNLRLTVKEAEIAVQIDSAIKEAYYWREKYHEASKVQVVKEKYIPGIYRAALWSWVGVVLLAAALVYFKRR